MIGTVCEDLSSPREKSPAEASPPLPSLPSLPLPAVRPPSDSQRASLWLLPPSLDGLLVGRAARVLGLHDVGELRGGGERLHPQLLERVI